MIYTTTNINGVNIEEYITGRILRIKYENKIFKLYIQSVDDKSVAIYLGHGELTMKIKSALREWCKLNGVEKVLWGHDKELDVVKCQ